MSEERPSAESASLAEYARHRGCSKAAVTQAIDAKKLVKSVEIVGKKRRIVDVALADQEWTANSARVTKFVKPATATAVAAVPTAPALAPAKTPVTSPESSAAAPETSAEVQGELVLGTTLIDAQMAYTNERTRKAWLENQQKEGRLVDRSVVAKEAFEADRIIREGLFNMSARISGKLAAETDPARLAILLDAAVRECLTMTANELVANHG